MVKDELFEYSVLVLHQKYHWNEWRPGSSYAQAVLVHMMEEKEMGLSLLMTAVHHVLHKQEAGLNGDLEELGSRSPRVCS